MLLLPTLAVAASAGPVRWERAARLPPEVRDAVSCACTASTSEQVIVRTRTGELWAHRGETWVRVAEATPLSASPDSALFTDGASIAVLGAEPAQVQWWTGRWEAVEHLPLHHATSLARAPEGEVWVAALFGRAIRETDAGWEPVVGLRGHQHVTADPTGGVWLWSPGRLVHRGAGRDREVPAGEATAAMAVAPDGQPRWEADAQRLVIGPAAGWLATESEVWRIGAERSRTFLPTGPVDGLGLAGPDGAWAITGAGASDGWLWVTRAGPPLGLIREAATWAGGLAGLDQMVAADLDGDGLDELIAAGAGEAVRVFAQEGGELVDQTVSWLPPETRGTPLAGCDLDGDGRSELILRPRGEAGLAVLRWRSGRLAPVPLDVDPALQGASGQATCADLTGDGAPELLIAGGGATVGRVWAFANDGTGHLAPVALPARGLQAPGQYTWQLHPADLDGDGHLDLLRATFWGYGAGVLAGGPDGWRDVSEASGLRGHYGTPTFNWLVDVDGDGARDWVVAGQGEVRVWAGRGLRFDDHTGIWGLGPADRGAKAAALADLDADDRPDLVVQHPDGTWSTWSGGPAGFAQRTRELPALPTERAALGVIRLVRGGEAALAVIVAGRSSSEVLIQAARPLPPGPPPRAGSTAIRWAWTPWPARAAIAALTLAWALGAVHRTARGLWLLVGVGAAGLALHALDAGAARAVPAIGSAYAGVAGWWLWVWARARASEARVVGGYRLGEVLGEGAAGVVFAAESVTTGERVAVKRLRLGRADDFAAFRQEAELGASVRHPNVCAILGYGEWRAPGDSGRPHAWLVLERLDGPTLRAVLDGHGPLAPPTAARIVRDVARGLHAVHAAGVVHRDVKPANIGFSAAGVVKLMDFGAARPAVRPTSTLDQFFGTVGYLSPERLRGDSATVASDVYALGVVLYECLGGPRPAAPLAPLSLERPPAVRPALWAVVERAVSAQVADRYADADALADALDGFAEDAPPLPPPPPVAPAPPKGWRAHAATMALLVRAYWSYARSGGRPDADAFATRWLSREPSEVDPTRRRDRD